MPLSIQEQLFELLSSLQGKDFTPTIKLLKQYDIIKDDEYRAKIIKLLIFLYNKYPALQSPANYSSNLTKVEQFIETLSTPTPKTTPSIESCFTPSKSKK